MSDDHKCPYGLTLCTPDDLCSYCERKAFKALVREMGEAIHSAIVNLPDHTVNWPCLCRSCAVGAMLKIVFNRTRVKKIMEDQDDNRGNPD